MKAEIEKIIDNHIGMTDSMDEDVSNAAAEIAKLCEADKYDALQAQDAAWHDIEDELREQVKEERSLGETWRKKMREARAKLAVMGEAFTPLIEMCYDDPNDEGDTDWNDVMSKAKEALSAAPKVVCSCESVATVTTKSNYGRDRPPTTYLPLSDEMGGWNIILKGKRIGDEPIVPGGQQVTVYVVTDESKPQEGDGEE